jgi:hypothetical protein
MSNRIGSACFDGNMDLVNVFEAAVHEGNRYDGPGRPPVTEPYAHITMSANDGQTMRSLNNRHMHTLDLRFQGLSWECKDLQVISGPESITLDDGTAAIKVGFKAPHNAIRKF